MLRCAMRSLLNPAQTRGLREIRYFDPDYLELLKPPLPVYEGLINVQLKGYDFPVLEQQTRKVEKLAHRLGIRISEVWATPLQQLKVQTYIPQSTSVDKSYSLKIYERNVQLKFVPGWCTGVFLELLQKTLAEGVTISVHEHLPEHTEIRQIPDLELEALEKQLKETLNPSSNPHVKKI